MYHIKSLFKEGTPILNTGLYHIILHYIYIYVYIYKYTHTISTFSTNGWNMLEPFFYNLDAHQVQSDDP